MIKNFMKLFVITLVSAFVYLNPFGQVEAYANTYDLNFNNYIADQANVLTDAQELKLNEMSKQLESKTSAELAGTENRLSVSRKDYNDSVKDLNKMLRTFPTSLVANVSGVDKREYFEVPESEKQNVKVSFD
jgi:hypothetical protein